MGKWRTGVCIFFGGSKKAIQTSYFKNVATLACWIPNKLPSFHGKKFTQNTGKENHLLKWRKKKNQSNARMYVPVCILYYSDD